MIRVLVIEESDRGRGDLAWLVRGARGITIIGVTSSLRIARRRLEEDHPDVVLADVAVLRRDGVELMNAAIQSRAVVVAVCGADVAAQGADGMDCDSQYAAEIIETIWIVAGPRSSDPSLSLH